ANHCLPKSSVQQFGIVVAPTCSESQTVILGCGIEERYLWFWLETENGAAALKGEVRRVPARVEQTQSDLAIVNAAECGAATCPSIDFGTSCDEHADSVGVFGPHGNHEWGYA